jgi:hypothetical protein
MNMTNFFLNLSLLSRASLVDATHKEVVSCALAVTWGLVRARPPTWLHVGMSYVNTYDTTHSCDMTQLTHAIAFDVSRPLALFPPLPHSSWRHHHW